MIQLRTGARGHLPRRSGRTRRSVAAAAACLVAGALAAACGGSGSANGSSTVTIAYVSTTADQMLARVTDQAGLFKKYGLNVKIVYLQQSAFMPALESGQVQFGLVSAPAAALATINGSPNIWVAQFESAMNLDLVAGPKVSSLKGLDGKSIGISSSGGSSDLLAQMAMEQGGFTAHEVPLGNLQNDLTALESGQVAAAILGPPLTYDIQSKVPGAHTLIDFSTEKDSLPGLGLVAYGSWLPKNGATTKKVLQAFVAGVTYYKSHPTQVEQIIKQYSGTTKDSDVQRAYTSAVAMLTANAIPATDTQQKLLNILRNKYPAAKGFDPGKLVDQTYMKGVLGTSG